MQEFELKYQVPHDRWAALAASLGDAPGGSFILLRAVYFDTPGRHLAQAGIALRLRREGEQQVQTLKAMAADGLTRLEHNVPRLGADGVEADLSLHDGTPAGERLRAVLQAAGQPLQAAYVTEMERLTVGATVAEGRVELALDRGEIRSGGRVLAVGELEIELIEGRHAAVLRAACEQMERHGLWLDVRSKAERGDRLARGVQGRPALPGRALAANAAEGAAAAWRRLLAALLPGLLRHASELCDEDQAQPQALRQAQWQRLRVDLRRLQRAAAGPAGELSAACRALRLQLPEAARAGEVLRSSPAQRLWLDLLAARYAA
ncbi:CYTH domain-containing protein [Eleftheria terrae]|uniref:CYTH domain-containing protein n=1 Tax=Eleftheria terrae TaxID=1597781 RepID=UPI00263B8369|nr:CYTH domain-containing protein [Eleftheria terrae]WKB52256.1 CYTH domain-containing protein [Eleftheria terrae]